MKNKINTGFVSSNLTITIVGIVAVSTLTYLFTLKTHKCPDVPYPKPPVTQNVPPSPTATSVIANPVTEPADEQVSDKWVVYKNSPCGIQFQIPSNWMVTWDANFVTDATTAEYRSSSAAITPYRTETRVKGVVEILLVCTFNPKGLTPQALQKELTGNSGWGPTFVYSIENGKKVTNQNGLVAYFNERDPLCHPTYCPTYTWVTRSSIFQLSASPSIRETPGYLVFEKVFESIKLLE